MHAAPQHPNELLGNAERQQLTNLQPIGLRTQTPSLAVIETSAGVFHWTTDGRQLFDFTSGVLVANLGHQPPAWIDRFQTYLGWKRQSLATPLTAYNAITPVELQATEKLLTTLQSCAGGAHLERVVWAASGSEAVHKALWAALHYRPGKDVIVATRYGFHGKKGLAFAVTGHEDEAERDPRVRFVPFPREECRDVAHRDEPFDLTPYSNAFAQLDRAWGSRIAAVITEPYLGGGGSYHPPAAYLQVLQQFARDHDALFILDEVQSNFGRTSELFAFTAYGLEPDLVVLGKGLGNGVPVAAVAGRADAFAQLGYGELSDTWSGNPLSCAAVLATLDSYADGTALANARVVSPIIEAGLVALKRLPFIAHVRGERNGMVWGIEAREWAGSSARDWANRIVLAAYRGDGPRGVHLLGPLAGTVVRVSPPLTITADETAHALTLLDASLARLAV